MPTDPTDSLGQARPSKKMMSELVLRIPGVQEQRKSGLGEGRVATSKTEKAGAMRVGGSPGSWI